MPDGKPRACDVLIENAILIAEAHAPPVTPATLAFADGRILFAGAAADAPRFAAARRIDAGDHLALPGLINVHTHAALCLVRGVAEDLGFAPAYTPGIPQGAMLTEGETVALARVGALEAMLAGSTLIADTYVHAAATLPAMAELGLRVLASPRIHDADLAAVATGTWRHDPAIGEATLAELEAVAQVAGRLPRCGVQIAAHAPDTCSRAFLRRVADRAARTGWQVTTHLAQSTAEVARVRERDGMSPVELLEECGLLTDRLLAAHCIHVSQHDIARIGRAGTAVAHIPRGNATGGTIAPMRALMQAGARLALATDNMQGDMIETMRWALAMGRVQAARIGQDWQPEHMLHAATASGAQALGLGDRIGALRAGMEADCVLVSLASAHLTPHPDPLGAVVHVGTGRDVRWVFVHGEAVVADGRPTRVEEAEVLREGRAAAASAWRRAAVSRCSKSRSAKSV
jgi:5-methylthioadenosine/S-adenosylhomocysteine deaminase